MAKYVNPLCRAMDERVDLGDTSSILATSLSYLPTVQGFPGQYRDFALCPGVQGFTPLDQIFFSRQHKILTLPKLLL